MDLDEIKYIHRELSKQIDREFELLGYRMNWLLMSSAFLFTATAIISGSNESGIYNENIRCVLSKSLPVIGLIICFIAFISMRAALRVVKEWKVNRKTMEDQLKAELNFNFDLTVPATTKGNDEGNVPYWILPSSIGVVWCLIVYYQFFNTL